MNALRRDIARCMTPPVTGAAGSVSAQCVFPPEFTGFQGHFPGRPILPAVCMVQAVLVLMETARRQRMTLKEIVAAKWSAPAGPGLPIQITVREDVDGDGTATIRAKLSGPREPLAEIKLRVVYEPDGKGTA